MIFQDPYASLDPRMTVGQIIAEPIDTFRLAQRRRATGDRVRELMDTVGLSERFINRYPHEFSGGQQQRIGIARALAGESGLHRRRRADLRARRVDSGADHQPDRAAAARAAPHLPLHLARPARHPSHVRPRGGDVSGQDRRARPTRAACTTAADALHEGADLRRAGARSGRRSDGAAASCCRATCRRRINPPSGCRFHTRCPYAVDGCRAWSRSSSEILPGHFAALHPHQPRRSRTSIRWHRAPPRGCKPSAIIRDTFP